MFGYIEEMIPTCIISVVVFVLTYVLLTRRRQFDNFPPGPTPFPLVGNLFKIWGKDVRQVFRDYRKKYGDIFTIHVLNRTIVVICGRENIKDVFVNRATEFSDRPAFKSLIFKGDVHGLVRIVHDLFLAGSETTATAIRFGMVCLLHHPGIQTRLTSDIQKVVPVNRMPDFSDKPNLPFVEATTFEILRRGCFSPFSVPHLARGDTEYKGYHIPKSAVMFPNLESVLMDDDLWDDPLKFNPSRFLDDKRSLVKTENLIPFSVGPRVCPGEGLAKTEMFLFLSAMLQRFKFLPPEGEDPPPLDTVYGTVCAPGPFKIRAIRL